MKLIEFLRETDDQRLDAEVGDYQLVGKWGDQEKSHSFRHAPDRAMIQHPTAIKKTRQKFGTTEHLLNFYFVNLPGAAKHAETGFMEPEQIAQALPKAWPEIQNRPGQTEGINVIFVGNAGVNRMPMTPWIMAHRIGHAIASAESGKNVKPGDPWFDYEQDFIGFMHDCLDQSYDWNLPRNWKFWNGGSTLAKFFEAIGTMRSARQNNLGARPYEFLYELFAQHIIQGAMRFNELPRSFGLRGQPLLRISDPDTAEMWSRDLNFGVSDHLGTRADNCLYSAEGKFLVM